MNTLLETLLAEAETVEEYEAVLEMFGEREAPEWGDKPRKREERREHFARKVGEAEAMILAWGWGQGEATRLKSYYADNLKKCSCWMCRSPRTVYRGKNSERLTKQELESITTYKQQLKELGE